LTEGTPNIHPGQGTANRRFFFRNAMLELLWVNDEQFVQGPRALAPAPTNALLGDAYAAQHPGTPSPQAIQSVAVHLLALYAVLEKGVASEMALWVVATLCANDCGLI
jgi:hypothetical protein